MRELSTDRKRAISRMRNYNWNRMLIFSFGMKDVVSDSIRQVEEWILDEQDDWGCKPSYIILGSSQSRIQGPAVYVLIAGASDEVDVSVEMWNKSEAANCIRVNFAIFGTNRDLRLKGAVSFLRGFVEVGALIKTRTRSRDKKPSL